MTSSYAADPTKFHQVTAVCPILTGPSLHKPATVQYQTQPPVVQPPLGMFIHRLHSVVMFENLPVCR